MIFPSSRRDCAFFCLLTCLSALGCSDDHAASSATPPDPIANGGQDAGAPTGDAAADAPVTPPVPPLPPGSVSVEGGIVSGAVDGETRAWKGIPYAAPPVGELRWRPPASVPTWDGTRPAVTLGAPCPQLDDDDKYIGDEDCLTLNVWAPVNAANAPVMVWIHGGGNVQGAGSKTIYDGRELATRTGSVVVTLNYRLGALGFFGHSSLDAESSNKVSGNYGILDQQAALRWVQANIAGFGGDKSKVMIFGESAGGQNTLVHIASPLSANLFSAAAVQSGGVYTTTLAQLEQGMKPLIDAANCGSAANVASCMRMKTAADLVKVPSAAGPLARDGLKYTPVVDGYVLPKNTWDAVGAGVHNKVPLILGTNADETSRMVPAVTNDAEYTAALVGLYGNALTEKVKTVYPVSRFPSARKALIAVTTDATWTCPIRRLSRLLAQAQTAPVYRYYFTWKASGAAGAASGSTHGLDVPFVFRTFSDFDGFTPDAAALALSESMQGYWSRLGSSGEPSREGGLMWPRFDGASEKYLELDETIAAKARLSTADCDFIDSLVP